MLFSPIAFIAPNYRDFKNEYLKAYEPGTTTPKVMALDSAGAVQVAKLQLNADGFVISAGNAIVIPYIEGSYDLWLFPTEAEADANDTSNAERLADNLDAGFINDLSKDYIFPTVAAYKSSSIVFPVDKTIHLDDRCADFKVISGTGTGNTFNIIASTSVSQSIDLITEEGIRHSSQFGAADGIADSFGAINACILDLPEGGTVTLPEGDLNIGANTIRDDIINGQTFVGNTITLSGVGANEDPTNSGKVTRILTTGANNGIVFTGNRSGGKDFSIEGDNGAFAANIALVLVSNSRAQWKNVLAIKSRGDGFWFRYGNSSSFENILCLQNKGNGFNADGTGYELPNGTPTPNDLNASTFINIDTRANGLIGFRTGVNSGFANNCYQITTQGNTGIGMEFNGNFWNVFGFYGEANDAGGTQRDISFTATAQGNFVYGFFSNVGGTTEDLSVNQRNYIEQVKYIAAEFHTQEVLLGEDTAPNGHIKISGEGDGTNPSVTLEGTSGSQTLEFFSSGAGTFKPDFKDGIVTDASTAPTLLNSWVNFGGSRKVVGFYKDAFEIVHLEGIIKDGTTTAATPLFVLPAGSRPTARVFFICSSNAGVGTGFIDADGTVYIESGSNVSFSLDNISFRTT